MEARSDKAAHMVRIAMDFTPYLFTLRRRHVVCDEMNYESTMLWAFLRDNIDHIAPARIVLLRNDGKVSVLRNGMVYEVSVSEADREAFLEYCDVYVAARPIVECEGFIETMTVKGLDVHAVSLLESGPYVWQHAVSWDAVT